MANMGELTTLELFKFHIDFSFSMRIGNYLWLN